MLVKRFREYLDRIFKTLPDTKEANDLRAELMDNLMSRAMDLQKEGYPDDDIYDLCIESLGDYSGAIRELNKNPLNVLRDTKFWRNILYAFTFALIVSVVYIVVGFATKQWGLAAVITFPALAGIVYICATAFILNRNIGCKRHLLSGIILSSYAVIAVLVAYFVLTFAFDLDVRKTWVVFTTIPMLCGGASMLTFTALRKKPIPFIVILAEIIFIALAVYMITAVILWQFHPYWIIMVIGVVIALFMCVFKINARLSKKDKRK